MKGHSIAPTFFNNQKQTQSFCNLIPVQMLVWSQHNICTWCTIYKYYQCFLISRFFFLNFVVCKLCQNFPFIGHFFLEFTLLKRISRISSKTFSPTAKIHPRKSLFYTEFLLFFDSRFICDDCPCNFSFAPTGCSNHSHWPGRTSTYTGTLTVLRKASQWLSLYIQRLRFCLRASPSQDCKQLLYVTIEEGLIITMPTHNHHKIPFKHPKTIYVFTSGPLKVTACPNTQQKKGLKGVKMTSSKLKSIPEQRRSYAVLLQDLMKRSVCRCRVAGSDKAQLMIHCLRHELWQNASIMHWVKSANSRKRVEQYFLGEF